jgi:hypothetical protein
MEIVESHDGTSWVFPTVSEADGKSSSFTGYIGSIVLVFGVLMMF